MLLKALSQRNESKLFYYKTDNELNKSTAILNIWEYFQLQLPALTTKAIAIENLPDDGRRMC